MKLWSNVVVVIFQLAMLAIVGATAFYLWHTLPPLRTSVVIEEQWRCPARNWLGRHLSHGIRTQADGGDWRERCSYKRWSLR